MLAVTARRYLARSACPAAGHGQQGRAVVAAVRRYLVDQHPDVSSFGHVGRVEIEGVQTRARPTSHHQRPGLFGQHVAAPRWA